MSGRVISACDKGMVVELSDGIHGMVQVSPKDVLSGSIELKTFSQRGKHTDLWLSKLIQVKSR